MKGLAEFQSEPYVVRVASASADDTLDVARQLAAGMPDRDLAALILFFSPDYDGSVLADCLAKSFPGVPIHGCSTAGELGPEGMAEGTVVAMGLPRREFSVVAEPILDLAGFSVERGRALAGALRARLSEATGDGAGVFGLLLIDGLCRCEEAVISAIYAGLDDVPVVGGSAGDALRFGVTQVICDGKAYANAAVLLLVRTTLPFRVFKSDHFEPTAVKMVVTEANLDARLVKELNAEPAAREYARAVGIIDDHLNAASFAAHPVVVRVGGEYYARSIQQVHPDGALAFFCAIDEGLVLTAARRRDMLESVRELFRSVEADIGKVDVYLGFDCVLRRLDAEQRQITRDLSDLYSANRVIGFNTYGEQFRSMHLNQTFTGVAIGRRSA